MSVKVLVIFFIFSFAVTYVSLGTLTPSRGDEVFLTALYILFPAAFAALIASIIIVSRRVIDSEDNPQVARSSRIFMLCIGFFYAIIGMFFISPRLKRLMAKVGN